MQKSDWKAVAAIYQQGIATGMATFEQEVPSYKIWDKAHVPKCRLVAEINHTVVGWAALSPVSSRCVYGGVGEVSVYIHQDHRAKGLATALMNRLVHQSEAEGFWTLQSGIFPENIASIQLHQKQGFRLLGKREKVAKLHGEWKDNLVFEKRSSKIGID